MKAYMSGTVAKEIEAFVKELERDGTLMRWEKRRKRQAAKNTRRRIMEAVNETLVEMEVAK